MQSTYSQQEVLPLPLDRLNRDSLRQVIEEGEKRKDYQRLSTLYGAIHAYFLDARHNDSATLYAMRSEACALRAGDSVTYYFMQVKLGELSLNAGNPELAKAYYLNAQNYYARTKNDRMLFHVYGSLAYISSLQKDEPSAARYDLLAVEANRNAKDTLAEVILNDLTAHAWIQQGRLDQSIALLKKNIALIRSARILGNSEALKTYWGAIEQNLLAQCYFLKKDYPVAMALCRQVLEDEATNDYPAQQMESSRLLVKSYAGLNQKDSVGKYIDQFFEQTVTALENLHPEKLVEISLKYETEKKQRQIAELQQKNRLQEIKVANQKKLSLAFVSICCLMLVVAYLIIRNYQHRRQVALERERQRGELEKKQVVESERVRISSELHDDLGGELSAIRLVSEMARMNKTQDLRKELSMISASAAELVQKVNEIVWALNVNNDTLQSLLSYMRRYAVKYLDDVGIACTFVLPQAVPHVVIDGTVRRNVFLLLKEAIHNVVKHARASSVTILVETGTRLRIQIHDDGIGLEEGTAWEHRGNGLQTMQKRVADLKGSLQLTGEEGTTILFVIPLQQIHTKVEG